MPTSGQKLQTYQPPLPLALPMPTPNPTYTLQHAPLFTQPRPIASDLNYALLNEKMQLAGEFGIPVMKATAAVPSLLCAFSETQCTMSIAPNTFVHFFEDDSKFARLWNDPQRFLPRIQRFSGAIAPDFSIIRNAPSALKIYNTYRNFLLGAWMQREGIEVIPNVRISGHDSVAYALAGVPHQSTLALGLHGCIADRENRARTHEELAWLCKTAQPRHIVIYGSSDPTLVAPILEQEIPITYFRPDTWNRSASRKAKAA